MIFDLKQRGELPKHIQFSLSETGRLIKQKPVKKHKKLRRKGVPACKCRRSSSN
jgi:hypothetical protein